MKELAKINGDVVTSKASEVENFTKEVSKKVQEILPVLPKDFRAIEVLKGDKLEDNLSRVISQIDGKARVLKDERLEITRKLSEITKHFTSNEKLVDEEVLKLTTFVHGWNSEKLRRQREEDEKQSKHNERKNALIEFRSEATSHYRDLLIDFLLGSSEKFETEFYEYDEAKLIAFKERVVDVEVIKEKSREYVKTKLFKFDKEDVDLVNIHNEVLTSMKDLFTDVSEKLHKKSIDLQAFVSTRIDQIKGQDEAKKQEEQAKLKAKQESERKAIEAKAKQETEDALLNAKIEYAIESAEAKPSVSLSKGASVKLKYYPKDHAQLLRMIKFYIAEEYSNVDFESLNQRLSFVRTACDSHLNKEGVVIEGVDYEEEVSKRKLSKK